YVLIFKKGNPIDTSNQQRIAVLEGEQQDTIRVCSSSALVRYRIIGTSTSGYTLNGKKAAVLLYEGLMTKNRDVLDKARSEYEQIIPKERIGDEYTALLWFCQYLLSSEQDRKTMLNERITSEYFNYFAKEDFKILKTYL